MTGLTRYEQLPYPASQRVRGNGAADVEALDVKTDAQLDRIGNAWTVVQKPDSSIFTLAAPITGLVSVQANPITPQNLSASWGTNPPQFAGPGSLAVSEAWGWYEVAFTVSSAPSGTANNGTRRTLVVSTLDDSGSNVPVQQYIREDYEALGGEVINQLTFVGFFGRFWKLNAFFAHGNTSSTLTVTTTATRVVFTRLLAGG